MVIKKYNGIKGVETEQQKEADYTNINNTQKNETSLEDKIVWMQMLEKLILEEQSLHLIEKIRTHFANFNMLDINTFNALVRECASEVDKEVAKAKEENQDPVDTMALKKGIDDIKFFLPKMMSPRSGCVVNLSNDKVLNKSS
jgi:hypothetical protein